VAAARLQLVSPRDTSMKHIILNLSIGLSALDSKSKQRKNQVDDDCVRERETPGLLKWV